MTRGTFYRRLRATSVASDLDGLSQGVPNLDEVGFVGLMVVPVLLAAGTRLFAETVDKKRQQPT